MTIEELKGSKKYSAITQTATLLTFSLVDYRNNYFVSDDPNKIIEFYNSFENREQLIQWMRERPKGAAYIQEVEGDKDIIVVIPTADFNGKYAKECRENIFKGLHIVFVESGEAPDPYFNYAHNCNVGIGKAIQYNPKWVVVSNDDMLKIDEINTLKIQLNNLSNKDVDCVFTQPSLYHSNIMKIAMPNKFFHLYYMISSTARNMSSLIKRFSIQYFPIGNDRKKLFFFKKYIKYIEVQDFFILSVNFVKSNEGIIFDEIFINHAEDTDLSIRIKLKEAKIKFINYKIGDFVGSTLGMGKDRKLRSLASLSYFTTKWDSELYKRMVSV